MTAVDWARYQKCPVCFAELGDPCWELFGYSVDEGPVTEEADGPHAGRKLRAGR